MYHYNMIMYIMFRCRSKKTSRLRVTGLFEGNPPMTGGFPSQKASNTENVSIWWCHHDFRIVITESQNYVYEIFGYYYYVPGKLSIHLRAKNNQQNAQEWAFTSLELSYNITNCEPIEISTYWMKAFIELSPPYLRNIMIKCELIKILIYWMKPYFSNLIYLHTYIFITWWYIISSLQTVKQLNEIVTNWME